MMTRTWPYGTTLPVEVLVSSKHLIAVRHEDEHRNGESFLLMGHRLDPLPKEGSSGTITFKQGGLTGGYWEFKQ